MDQTADPATVEIPKPSEVLRELLQHPPLNWTESRWTRLVYGGSGSDGMVECHCQGMMLANYAMARGIERPLGEEIGAYIMRVYDMPRGVLTRAMDANDRLDLDDAKKLWGFGVTPSSDYLLVMQQLAPKYLARAIAVYEEAGL